MNRILLTGGAGFIGSHIADALSKKYPQSKLVILDKMTYAASFENLTETLSNNNSKLIVGDICNFDLCLKLTKNTDLVLNLAAESHVDNSFGNSLTFTKTNTLGTHSLMEACRINSVSKIIHVSTDEVYGDILKGSFDENSTLNPTNPYSASKAAAEMIINSYVHSFNLPIITVRANNIYGIRQYPEKIIPKFCLQFILGKKITIHGTGENVRSYLNVKDFAEAIMLLIIKGNIKEQYNIGTNEEYSNINIAKIISSLFNKNLNQHLQLVEDRPFNDKRYSINFTKINSLGWSPKRSLKDEISHIVQWYKDNYFKFYDLNFENEETLRLKKIT